MPSKVLPIKSDKGSVPNETPPFVVWLRSVGGIGLFIGLGSMLLGPESFCVFAWCICVGLVVLVLDLWFEPNLKILSKALTTLVIVGFLGWFLKERVFVPAPLDIQIQSNELNPTKGSGGIDWKDNFSNLQVQLVNSSSITYKQADIVVESDLKIMTATVRGAICSIKPVETGDELWRKGIPEGVDANGQQVLRPYIPSPDTQVSARQYRLLCPEIPSKMRVEMAFELLSPTIQIGQMMPVFGPRRMPSEVKISGRFEALGRYRKVSDYWKRR